MAHISRVVQRLKKELEKELERAKLEVERFGAALVALGSKSGREVGRRRRLSVAARKKISLAQKARWAKKKASGPSTISAASRRRMVAAQKARWARAKRKPLRQSSISK